MMPALTVNSLNQVSASGGGRHGVCFGQLHLKHHLDKYFNWEESLGGEGGRGRSSHYWLALKTRLVLMANQ